MANITVTINCGFSTFARSLFPNFESEAYNYANEWFAYKNGALVASYQNQNGISVSVNNFRLDRTVTDEDVVEGGVERRRYRYYKYEIEANYPDDWFNAVFECRFIESRNPTLRKSDGGSSLSPIIHLGGADPMVGPGPNIWPTIGTVDEKTVTYPFGIYAKGRQEKQDVDAEVTQLMWDWGDGTIESFALNATEENSQFVGSVITTPDGNGGYIYTYQKLSVGNLSLPVSHTFAPDENGNGTGVPISIYAVDSMGRKSPPVYSKIGPHAEIVLEMEEATNSVIVNSKKSYGRTGKISSTMETRLGFSSNGGLNPRPPDVPPNKWRVGAALNGPYYAYLSVTDQYNDSKFNGLGYSAGEGLPTFKEFAKAERHWYFHRPPFSALPWQDGSSLVMRENGENPSRSALVRKFVNPKNFPQFNGFTAPRLFRDGATLYCAGRAQNGSTRLWRSRSFGEPWEDFSMIWTPEFYHAEPVSLLGGGAACLAVKRIELSETSYDVELWFRATFDLKNWDAEPVKVATLASALALENTFGFYPLLINEALAGRAPRLVAGSNTDLTHESLDGGASWNPL